MSPYNLATEEGRVGRKATQRRYLISAKGRAAQGRGRRAYLQSQSGRGVIRAYLNSAAGKVVLARANRKYASTAHGRKLRAANQRARQDGISVVNYKRLSLAIDSLRCYDCGSQAEQVDHVLPVGFARLVGLLPIVDEYVAPVCRLCHAVKTRLDWQLIYGFR